MLNSTRRYRFRTAFMPVACMLCLSPLPAAGARSASIDSAGRYLAAHRYTEALDLLTPSIDSARSRREMSMHRLERLLMGSYAYAMLGVWDSSYALARESLPVADTLKVPGARGNALMNMGIAAKSWGRFDEAQRRYHEALTAFRESADTTGMAKAYANLGVLFKEWARYDKARQWYLEALALGERRGDTTGMIANLNNLAGIHFTRDDTLEARRLCDRALRLARAAGNHYLEAYLLENTARFHMERHEYDAALVLFGKAGELAAASDNRESIAWHHYNRGLAYAGKEEYDSALYCLDSALTRFRVLEQKPRIADVLTAIGRSRWKMGSYAPAVDTLRRAVGILEELRRTATGETRRDYLSSQIAAYQWLVSSHLRAGDTAVAAETAEQATARYLAESVANSAVPPATGLESYRRSIPRSTVYLRYVNAGAEAPLTVFAFDSRRLVAYEVNVDSLEHALARQVPRIRQTAASVVTRGIRVTGTEPLAAPDLETILAAYRVLLSRPHLSGSEAVALRRLGTALFDFLIGPVTGMLEHKEEIVFIPDGFLATVPFETMMTPRNRYLIEEYTTRYLPSLTVATLIARRKRPPRRATVCAFGGARYRDSTAPRVEPLTDTQVRAIRSDVVTRVEAGSGMVDVFERVGLDEWPDLPATRMEVEAIGSLFDDASVITGRDVNEAGIRQASRSGSLAGFRFLHFAVHGIVVAAIPQLSALVLSSASTRQGDSDDYLMAHEIARLSLASDAVILSACETGLGRIYPGEGVVGLTHAFLTAGSRGVTSSLWQIADESTKDFMVAVYTHMAADKTPFHRALARVKRSFIRGDITPATSTGTDSRHESYRHPFFWAPFVYFGD